MRAPLRGPDFLGVGAHRSGSSWLFRVLSQHPELWLPPVKELHYFDKPGIHRTIWSARERRRAKLKGASSPAFWLRYWLGARDDDWYAALFAAAQRRGLRTGEITPAYATLPAGVFERMRRRNPALRIVYVMREPIERTWSAVNHAFEKRGGAPGTLSVAEALGAARHPSVAARSDYLGTIRRLESVFPREQIHYGFFEDLRDAPERFARALLAFLGVDPKHVREITLPRAVNAAAVASAVPAEFAAELARDVRPALRALCERLGGAPRAWLGVD
ncbi:MAG TPA: sulfotransferase [Myxococcota bacterium]|nr:sulfotransferase [Myxococcota bacterium]